MCSKMIALTGLTLLMILSLSSGAAEIPEYTRTDYQSSGIAGEVKYLFAGFEDDDAFHDLIAISPGNDINVFPGGPGGIFGTPVVTTTGINRVNMALSEDFTGDGLSDIILNDILFIAKGNGEFFERKTLGIANLQTIAATDVNGDGNKDIIAIVIINPDSETRAAELRTYFGNGDGTFREPVITQILANDGTNGADWGTYYIYYAGDFTGNGIPDLVVRRRFSLEAGYTLSHNWSYIGNSDGTFIKKYFIESNGNMFAMEVKDVNGDGIKDIIDLGKNTQYIAGDNTGVFLSFSSIIFDINMYGYICFSVSDVNGDGILDYTFARVLEFQSDMSLSTALGTRDGDVGEKYTFMTLIPRSVWFDYGWAYETNKPLTFDFNNDDCADFIIPWKTTGEIAVMLSNKSTLVHEDRPRNELMLGQNAPNPFNSSTIIPYTIYRSGVYELVVYDILGRTIVTLFSDFQSSGEHKVAWNGKGEHGEISASGCYFYILREKGGNGFLSSKKLLFMK